MRCITEAEPRRRVQYNFGEWHRDSVLEMIAVDPADPNTHVQYPLNKGYDVQTLPLCIKRHTCLGSRHFFPQCPVFGSDEQCFSEWA